MWRLLLLFALGGPAALADPPNIIDSTTTVAGSGLRVSVTLAHPDTGWDHYADGWEVLDSDGRRIGLRELLHPHVAEQPFTRSLTLETDAPAGTLRIRARCSVEGWAAATAPIPPQ